MKNPYLKLDPASRREFMLRTAKTALGVSVLSGFDNAKVNAASAAAQKGGKAKAVIYLFMDGGMSHIDTFDPKTGSTQGPKAPISGTGAAIQFGGYMPNVAKHAGKLSIIRSMTSKTGVHQQGVYIMHTGYEQRGTVVHPTLGSWAQHFKGRSHETLPSSVVIGSSTSANAGFFAPALAPVPITSAEAGLQNSKSSVSDEMFKKRIALMNEFDSSFRDKYKSAEVRAYTEFYDETMNLLTSKDLEAFDLTKESPSTRDMYGKGFGQGCLLARRLVQSGVRFVEVTSKGWDMHNYIDEGMERMGNILDNAFAALLSDLESNGMLDSTLVVLGSEFGRTPDINENSGRDHYPKVFTTVMAGGGVKGGYVHGASDKDGREVADKQVTVQDFIATIGAAMGLPVEEEVMSPSGRPFYVGDKSSVVVNEIFA